MAHNTPPVAIVGARLAVVICFPWYAYLLRHRMRQLPCSSQCQELMVCSIAFNEGCSCMDPLDHFKRLAWAIFNRSMIQTE